MIKRLYPLVVVAVCLWAHTGYPQEAIRVAVLPFEIYAQEELGNLKAEIPAVIKKHLQQQGAAIVDADLIAGENLGDSTGSAEGIRTLGLQTGSDYVVWGSVTFIEHNFSIDAQIMDTFGEEPSTVYFVEGERSENLSATVRNLADHIALKLFKRQKVVAVRIEGNQRIEADAIQRVIDTRAGDIYRPQRLSEDLKAVYAMGYFDDIRIEAQDGLDGKTVIVRVAEKPSVRMVRIKGNNVFNDEEIGDNLDLHTGSILNVFNIQNDIQRIESLYRDKNYHNVKVTYAIEQLENKQADLDFMIDEGEKLRVKNIVFEGNRRYSSKKLKGFMKTSEKGFFSWISSSGDLNPDDLSQDVLNLTAFYHNNGYIQARVGEPQVVFEESWIDITIKIDEGPQFKVGAVEISGDLVTTVEKLKKRLKITPGDFFSRDVVRNDVLALTDVYSDEGYANADIVPSLDQDFENLQVNITYTISQGPKVYFEKIIIGGNTKTRDKVIRRQLRVYEKELYRGRQLKEGVRNLYRLDYFEDVKVDTQPGSTDDQMILKIDVTEKPTGAFTFGGGYSSSENLFTVGSISQRNLFGRGQNLELKAQLGGTTNRFSLNFVEPWLFDIPLSLGLEVFDWNTDFDDYEKDSLGGAIRLGYPVWRHTRGYVSYRYETTDIVNVEEDAALSIRQLEGTNLTSAMGATLHYDSRDRVFHTSRGSNHRLDVEYAGFGGDIAFTKYIGETGWYFPLVWSTVLFSRARAGYVEQHSGGILPDYERFHLGGINTLRGFNWRDLAPKDAEGADIGGDKFVQFNFELQFPLFEKAGLRGVLFVDTGDVYDQDEDVDFGNLRESAGGGFRWYSPIGPIRLEYGYILDPQPGEEDRGRWEFTMGSAF